MKRALVAVVALALATPAVARADVVAALPTAAAPGLGDAVTAQGHTLVAPSSVAEAVGKISDGTADTTEELAVVAQATKAEWIVTATPPAEGSARLELNAFWSKTGRLESVARELTAGKHPEQLREMLAVLLRTEGVGTAELPWEKRGATPTSGAAGTTGAGTHVQITAPNGPATPEAPRVPLDTPRLFAAGAIGFALAVARPEGAIGTPAAFRLAGRFGARVWAGLDVFGQLGGYWAQAGGVTIDAGARYVIPVVGGATSANDKTHGFELGIAPELVGGLFVIPGASATRGDQTFTRPVKAGFTLGGSVALVARVNSPLELALSLGDVRWITVAQGSVVYAGATASAGYRF